MVNSFFLTLIGGLSLPGFEDLVLQKQAEVERALQLYVGIEGLHEADLIRLRSEGDDCEAHSLGAFASVERRRRKRQMLK